jgi:hypothetical protein
MISLDDGNLLKAAIADGDVLNGTLQGITPYLVFDNCDDDPVVTAVDEIVEGSCPGNYTILRTYTAEDNCGNVSEPQVQVITVVDEDPPLILCPGNFEVQCVTDVPACDPADLLYLDNCTEVSVDCSQSAPFGLPWDGWVLNQYTATDECGNSASCTQTVFIYDSTPPTAICQDITIYLDYPSCTATITPPQVDGGSFDNCSPVTLVDIDVSSFDDGDIGDNPVTLTVRDENFNESSCVATVTVLGRPTVVTNLGVFEGQYSDYPVLNALLVDQFTGNPLPGYTIHFSLNGRNASAVTNGAGVATTNAIRLDQAPNILGYSYDLVATFDGADCYLGGSDTDPFEILQEDARVTYTGKNFASTISGQSSDAVVLLAATVCDISSTPDAAGDTYPGDISNATVTFVDRDNGNAPISPPLPVVPLPGDTTKGTVSYVWMTNIGFTVCKTYNIGIVVNNYYTRDDAADDQVIEVCRPGREFVTGGGWTTLWNSFGYQPADPGTHCNFGFNANFRGREKRIGGNLNVIYREGGDDYQIKSIKVVSLGIDSDNNFAEFCGTGKITNTTTGEVIYPIGTFLVKLTDNGNPGIYNDMISFDFFAVNGALVFSSNWAGTYTVQQLIEGGNLHIHSPGNPNAGDVFVPGEDDVKVSGIDAEVYPNPFNEQVNISFSLQDAGSTMIDVISLSGEIVASEDLGMLDADMRHHWTFDATDKLTSGTYFYRIISGQQILTGKMQMIK